MKRSLMLAFSGIVAAVVLAACGGSTPTATEASQQTEAPAPTTAATEATTATAEAGGSGGNVVTLKLGFTASQTGAQNVAGINQLNGINLWLDDVNKDGIKVGDKTVKFQAVFYDDESATDRVQQLYTKLATDDNVDLMISPYTSGLVDAAAVIAQQYNKIMITTGGASESTYQKGYTLVYQMYTPGGQYLTGALDLLASADPSAKKVAIVHENDKFSTGVAAAAEKYAKDKGFTVVMSEGYDTPINDFGPLLDKLQAAQPDAIIGGGHVADGTLFAKQIAEKKIGAKFVALLVAPPETSFAQLGDPAVGVIGPSQWEPGVTFSADTAKTLNIPFIGPSQDEFLKAYKAKYNTDPTYHSAGGYAAGLVLAQALQDAGSTDTDAIKAALDKMDLMTFFGHIKFDTSAENHGLQVGHTMVYMQWQKPSSDLVKMIVWPQEAATGKVVYPKP